VALAMAAWSATATAQVSEPINAKEGVWGEYGAKGTVAQPPPPPPAKKKDDDPAVDRGPLGFDVGEFRLTPHAQYRIRYRHHEGHDFAAGSVNDTLRHRARLGMSVMWQKMLGVTVQLQDVRTFGEETNTLGDYHADGFDLHEAYAVVAPFQHSAFRLGRQEIRVENERLVGAVDWSEQGRSFDALRFLYRADGLNLDGFYAKVREQSIVRPQDQGSIPAANRHLLGANLHQDLMSEFRAGLVVLADHDRNDGRRQHTVGAIAGGEIAELLRYEGEGYYQFGGAYGDVSYSAFLAAAKLRLTFDIPTKPFLEAYGAFLSGDDNPDDLTRRTFETVYATNHKFYGEMDFFLDIARDTQERGLRDIGGMVGASPFEGFKLHAAYHLFQAMAERADGLETFGHELDVKGVYRFWKHARVALLYGVFFPGDIKKRGVVDPRAEHFAYSTLDVKF